jgi:hypothetical protein
MVAIFAWIACARRQYTDRHYGNQEEQDRFIPLHTAKDRNFFVKEK